VPSLFSGPAGRRSGLPGADRDDRAEPAGLQDAYPGKHLAERHQDEGVVQIWAPEMSWLTEKRAPDAAPEWYGRARNPRRGCRAEHVRRR